MAGALAGTLLLVVFHPFGLTTNGWQRWVLLIGLLLVAIVCVILGELLVQYVLRMPNDMERGFRYIRRRNLTFQAINIPMVSFGFWLYDHLSIGGERLQMGSFVEILLYMVVISIGLSFYWRNEYESRYLQQQLEETRYLNGILEERNKRAERERRTTAPTTASTTTAAVPTPTEAVAPPTSVTLQGTTRESVTLAPDDLLYAESDSNYVNIYHLVDSKPHQTQLRITIHQVEEVLAACPSIRRCHRAFVVNLQHVTSVDSTGHAVSLLLRGVKNPVPVSRTYLTDIREKIINL